MQWDGIGMGMGQDAFASAVEFASSLPLPLQLAAFSVAYCVSAATFIPPAAALTAAAGVAFGPYLGVAAASVASTCGAAVAFTLSRTVLRTFAMERAGNALEGLEKQCRL